MNSLIVDVAALGFFLHAISFGRQKMMEFTCETSQITMMKELSIGNQDCKC
jgi:hypothetical protein